MLIALASVHSALARGSDESDIEALLRLGKYRLAWEKTKAASERGVPITFAGALAGITVGKCDETMSQYLPRLSDERNVALAREVLPAASTAAIAARNAQALECVTKGLIAARGTTRAAPVASNGMRGHVQIGIGHDSNVNTRSEDGFAAGGILLPQSQPISDMYWEAGGAIALWHRTASRQQFYVSGSVDHGVNFHEHDFDRDTVDLTAGSQIPIGTAHLQTQLSYSQIWYGQSTYQRNIALEASLGLPTRHGTLEPLMAITQRRYPDPNEQFNSHAWSGGLRFQRATSAWLQPAWTMLATVTREVNTADSPELSRTEYLGYVRLGILPAPNLSSSLFAYCQRSNYATTLASGTDRTDTLLGVGAAIEYQFGASQWSFVVEMSYATNRSNVDVFRYDRTIVMSAVRYGFGR